MIEQIYMLGYKRRALVALFVLLVTLVTGSGMLKLQVDTSVDSLIPTGDPSRLVYQRIMGEFGTDNKTIIYISDPDLWTPDKLAKIEKLHFEIEKIDGVSRVDSLFTLNTVQGKDDKIVSRPLLLAAPKTEQEALKAKKSALENSLYQGNYFSDDGNVTAIIVSVNNAEDSNNFNRAIYLALEERIQIHRGGFERIAQVGPPRINAELKHSLYEDFILLGP